MLVFMSENQKDAYALMVGQRLANARRGAVPKITQAEAAEKLGLILGENVAPSRIANYEQGLRLPQPPVVNALCSIYGTATASYVLGLHDGAQNFREAKLLEKYRIADERGKYSIDSVAESQSIVVKDDRVKKAS